MFLTMPTLWKVRLNFANILPVCIDKEGSLVADAASFTAERIAGLMPKDPFSI